MINTLMYDMMYRFSKPVWDDDEIPVQVVDLAGYKQKGRLLDLGCGTGTHAIYLAQRGFEVTGVDVSATAIRQAQIKAENTSVPADFRVLDATHLDSLRGPFDLVLDVGCLHSLRPSAQRDYVAEINRLTKPGSVFLLWGIDSQRGFGLTTQKVDEILCPYFHVALAEPSNLHGRLSTWYWLVRS